MGGSDGESRTGERTSSLLESAPLETLRFKSQPLLSLVIRDFARVSSICEMETMIPAHRGVKKCVKGELSPLPSGVHAESMPTRVIIFYLKKGSLKRALGRAYLILAVRHTGDTPLCTFLQFVDTALSGQKHGGKSVTVAGTLRHALLSFQMSAQISWPCANKTLPSTAT